MRIWLLTSELAHEQPGGIGRYVDTFSRLLGEAGHEVVIIARSTVDCDRELARGVRLIGYVSGYERLGTAASWPEPDDHPAFPYNVLGYAQAHSWQIAARVLQLLEQLPAPDVIESQDFAALPYFLIQRKLTERSPLEGIPILVHLHGPLFELLRANQEPRYRFPEYWTGRMEAFCVRAADAVIAPSRFLAGRVQQEASSPADISIIPYPSPDHGHDSASTGAPGRIVYIGRLQVLKGVLPLVQACASLWSEGREFELVMIGGDTKFAPRGGTVGEYIRKRYAAWIERGRLRILGRLAEYKDVLAHMRDAWAVVVPSHWENFPYVCIEAMSLGQLVVASCTGGQAEMVGQDGEYGFLFDWAKQGDFERALTHTLALTPEDRLRIVERARRRIHEICSPEVVIPQRIEHYRRVIEQHRPKRVFPAASPQRQSRECSPVPACAPLVPGAKGEQGLLSVIVPFYNLGAYVVEALESILRSTYSPLEVLIVNDGSTDPASVATLRELEGRRTHGLRVLHRENQGLATARNTGAAEARGEFIAFVDADDMVEADFFARAVDVLQRYPNVDFVYPWLRFFGDASGIWPTWNTEFPYLLGHNLAAVLVVLRRESFLGGAGNNPAVAYSLEDYETWVRLVEAGGVGVSLPHPLARYRVRKDSMLQSTNTDAMLYLHDLISELHPEAYRQWGVELFNLQNANGPARLWNHPATNPPSCSGQDVRPLEEARDQWYAEAQRLARAWEQQKAYIDAMGRDRTRLQRELEHLKGNGGPSFGRRVLRKLGIGKDRENRV